MRNDVMKFEDREKADRGEKEDKENYILSMYILFNHRSIEPSYYLTNLLTNLLQSGWVSQ